MNWATCGTWEAGARTLLFTLVLSSIAVTIGVVLVNTFRPGEHLSESKRSAVAAQYVRSRGERGPVAAGQDAEGDDAGPDSRNPLQEMVGGLDASSKGNGYWP